MVFYKKREEEPRHIHEWSLQVRPNHADGFVQVFAVRDYSGDKFGHERRIEYGNSPETGGKRVYQASTEAELERLIEVGQELCKRANGALYLHYLGNPKVNKLLLQANKQGIPTGEKL